MLEKPTIQWFPGHMKKTERLIRQNLSQVDVVIELLDARIPNSSQNPFFQTLLAGQQRVLFLNKSDLADPTQTKLWIEAFAKAKLPALAIHCQNQSGVAKVFDFLQKQMSELLKRRAARGMTGQVLRAMVVGIPNTGKSTFINQMAGRKCARAENRPGVTQTKQWVHIGQNIDLLDMPGTLWPKFDSPDAGLHLAYTGAIKDTVFDNELVAMHLLLFLSARYPQQLAKHFHLSDLEKEPFLLLEAIGRSCGMLLRGNEVDTQRASVMLLDKFRSGKLGRITLELQENVNDAL